MSPLRVIPIAAAALSLSLATAQAQAPTDVRVALVIGNGGYQQSPLLNPVKDARAMAAALRSMGFQVVEVHDAEKAQMERAIADVGGRLKDRNGVGMLYFAGHGLQLDWRNYMLPVDARPNSAADVAAQTVDIQSVIAMFKQAGNRMNIVVLDACRDNPFGSTATGKGLAPLDAPSGTFLAYATAPGSVAEDGSAESGNGLYTSFLVKELVRPQARIEDVFKRVRLQVRQASQGRQIPWESTSLEVDFTFAGSGRATSLSPRERELAFNEEKAAWDKVSKSTDVNAFYEFLTRYPTGFLSELAQSRVDELQRSSVKPTAGKGGVEVEDPRRRYRDGDRYEFVFRDGQTGAETGRGSIAVRKLDDAVLEAVGKGMPTAKVNSTGFVLADAQGTYDPPWVEMPASPFQVGKRWSSRSLLTRPNGQTQWVDIDTHVAAQETVTVPMGTFATYRVDVKTLGQDGIQRKMSFWYDPAWGYAIKRVVEIGRVGATPDIRVREMVSRQRGS